MILQHSDNHVYKSPVSFVKSKMLFALNSENPCVEMAGDEKEEEMQPFVQEQNEGSCLNLTSLLVLFGLGAVAWIAGTYVT